MQLQQYSNDNFFDDVRQILAKGRQYAYAAVNSAMVQAYWLVGKRIVEQEQHGEIKASYGEGLLKELSRTLTKEFGRGFSYSNLRNFRQFFLTYPDMKICDAVRSKLGFCFAATVVRQLLNIQL